jgi:hypothetical protein
LSKLKTLFERLEARIAEKNTSVTDIREAYDSLKRHGAVIAVCKEAVKWRKKGLAAYEAHTIAVAQMLVELEGLQLDFFAKASEPIVFTPPVPTEADISEDDVTHTDDAHDPAETEGNMRQVGEVAETVVEAIREVIASGQQPISDEVTPDQQAEAKLEGEKAGRQGHDAGLNPWPLKDSRHSWWNRGHAPAYATWQVANPTVASINAAPKIPGSKLSRKFTDEVVSRGKGPQPGFQDKTPRMGAAAAAKMLDRSASE